MTNKPPWTQGPVAGSALIKLAELYARALRVDAARRARDIQRMYALLAKDAP